MRHRYPYKVPDKYLQIWLFRAVTNSSTNSFVVNLLRIHLCMDLSKKTYKLSDSHFDPFGLTHIQGAISLMWSHWLDILVRLLKLKLRNFCKGVLFFGQRPKSEGTRSPLKTKPRHDEPKTWKGKLAGFEFECFLFFFVLLEWCLLNALFFFRVHYTDLKPLKIFLKGATSRLNDLNDLKTIA